MTECLNQSLVMYPKCFVFAVSQKQGETVSSNRLGTLFHQIQALSEIELI